ncbi:MAG: ankyrin repeat domain-containing protein [Verrucomicrobia bacterium]|nr:ankyrin repeat domain-containing protein [Verrucomicrobiota bacterium]
MTELQHILPFKNSRAVWFSVLAAALLLGCGQSKDQALGELAKLNVKFTPDDFVQAADRGDLKALQLFLDGGMDCDAQNASGSTALMAAAKNGRIDVVNKLLEQKLNLNLQDKQGETALMWAAANNQVAVVKVLLTKGADTNLQDQSGWSALMKAVYQGNTACVQTLVGQSRQEVNRALLVAALTGHRDIAKILLDNGAEVDTRADDGRTPLMLAATRGDTDLVSLLLASGADPTLIDRSGETAGTLALSKGYTELANRFQHTASPAAANATATQQPATGGTQPQRSPSPLSSEDVVAHREGPLESYDTEKGRSHATRSDNLGQTKPVSVVEINEKLLPVIVTEVSGSKAKIRDVGGGEYSVSVGDDLKGLDYKVADIEVRHTEDKDGNPVDDSVVKLHNTKSGRDVELIKGVRAQEQPAFAILALSASDQTLKVEIDQTFTIPSDPSHSYKVLDIRPAQVVLRRVEDNRVITLQKKTAN